MASLFRRRLPLADAAGLVAFAVAGLVAHDGTVTPGGLARDAAPFIGAWLVVATAVGLYRRPGPGRFLATWATAVPLAVLVRALALGKPLDGRQGAFLATSLVLGLAFVLAARAVGAAAVRGAAEAP